MAEVCLAGGTQQRTMAPLRMKKLLTILLLQTAGMVGATVPTTAGPELVAGTNDAAWLPLFESLDHQGGVYSTFTEKRWFSVKKEPVVLHGELRHSAARGLSLLYTQPEEQLMVVDDHGLFMRNAAGHTRTMAADAKAPRIDTALLPVLRFDLAAVRQLFTVHAAREGEDWRLDLVPRTTQLTRYLSTLVVEGKGERVCRLEFRRTARQRVEVLIGETRTGISFSSEEEKRYFRAAPADRK
jgi:hypothetical protein